MNQLNHAQARPHHGPFGPLTATVLAVLAGLVALVVLASAAAPAKATEPKPISEMTAAEIKAAHQRLNVGINYWRARTWYWQRVVHGRVLTPASQSPAAIKSLAYKRWVAELWIKRARAAKLRAQNVPHYASWICIHKGEGAWNANTGNGYYGGLQMDMTFQRTYGPWLLATKGTANRWTPLEQLWVAERARASGRGWYPWPNTARHCGLI